VRGLVSYRRGALTALVAAIGVAFAVALGAPMALAAPSISGSSEVADVTTNSALVFGEGVSLEGIETRWRLEYSTNASGGWAEVPGGSGTIPAGEAANFYVTRSAYLTGLSPESTYYLRFVLENATGSATSPVHSFETAGEPGVRALGTHALHGEAMRVLGVMEPHGGAVDELQAVRIGGGATGGTFKLCFEGECTGAGGIGTVTSGSNEITDAKATSGVFLEEEGISGPGVPPGTKITTIKGNSTIGETLILSAPATESTSGATLSSNLAFEPREVITKTNDAREEDRIFYALRALPSIGESGVGVRGGSVPSSYIVEFLGRDQGVNVPQLTADASGLTPSGTITVSTLEGGSPFEVHYHFEYVSERHFEETGFSEASVTPESANGLRKSLIVGADLPGLQAGEKYHFRLVASSSAPGSSAIDGGEQTLTAPSPGPMEEPRCANERLRSGPSAALPDCRAYELVTPPEKGGAMDIFNYAIVKARAFIGEDGEHLALHAPGTQWGASPDPKVSDYFFTRTVDGWRIQSARPMQETSLESYQPELFSPNLGFVGVEAGWATGIKAASEEIAFQVGPPGGPYTTVALVPRPPHLEGAGQEEAGGWAAMSADGSKAILEVTDHSLLGAPTGTGSGYDLYEYSEGQLRQLNVNSAGTTIGSCGARMAAGDEGYAGGGAGSGADPASSHSVSADGSRVFYEAAPGASCSAPHHLYMRVDGESTVDIGAYSFLAANRDGTQVLMEREQSGVLGVFLYETETGTATLLFEAHSAGLDRPIVSEEMTELYFRSPERLTPEAPAIGEGSEYEGTIAEDLYRYDLQERKLHFVVQSGSDGALNVDGAGGFSTSPDGRYFYWVSSGVAGAPAGGKETLPEGQSSSLNQVWRYDSVENVVQCMSCASPFDPSPDREATFLPAGEDYGVSADNTPNASISSPNGDYVFFDTPAALVPQDVDGEVPNGTYGEFGQTHNFFYSTSSDVYEWRKNGVDGCGHVQGCVALISSGTGGLMNMLLGTADEGRDVFFATHSQLVAQDADGAGDVYDARIGGGFPGPAPPPVECEGDACSTPTAPPVDTTPASLSFSGAGNLAQPAPAPAHAPKAKGKHGMGKAKSKAKAKGRAKGKKSKAKGKGESKGRSGKAAVRRGDGNRGGGR
jgi:hypothetical protein